MGTIAGKLSCLDCRRKQYAERILAAVRVLDDHLVLETLHFPDEVRSTVDLPQITNVKLTAKEKEIALTPIDQLTAEFDPTKYHDEYRAKLEKLIESKIDFLMCRFLYFLLLTIIDKDVEL